MGGTTGMEGANEIATSEISDYEMLSDLFVFSEIKELENFALKNYKNGAKYKGQINPKTGEREGYGVMVHGDGKVYEG